MIDYVEWLAMDSATKYAEFRKHYASLDAVFDKYTVTVTYDQDEREYKARIKDDESTINAWFGYGDSPAEAVYFAALNRIGRIT